MELDGYAEAISLAFEYQGEQHYNREFLHKPSGLRAQPTEAEFEWLCQRDREKRHVCRQNGVSLIEVPWTADCLRCFIASRAVEFFDSEAM